MLQLGRIQTIESYKKTNLIGYVYTNISYKFGGIIMKTGAIIVAAGTSSYMNDFQPMLKVGRTTIIKRIITTLKDAGVDTIVVITGNKADELEKHISNMGVICLRNERFNETQMFDSARIGLEYIQDKCDRTLFTPVDIPLVSKKSVSKLLNSEAKISCLSHNGFKGHPLLISSELIPELLSYTGTGGLRGAIKSTCEEIKLVSVDDQGILMDIDTPQDYENLILKYREIYKSQPLCFSMQLQLSKENTFFDPKVAEFLTLVDQTGSMQTACRQMHMAYSKAWKMVNLVEEQLGFLVLSRHAGGSEGGSSQLTEQGKNFTKNFIEFQKETTAAADTIFNKYFPK
jgi:molybdate transport repressor ModE-like protein